MKKVFLILSMLVFVNANLLAQPPNSTADFLLRRACQTGNLGLAQQALRDGANINNAPLAEDDNQTPLMIASMLGVFNNVRPAPDLVRFLIANGANLQAHNPTSRWFLEFYRDEYRLGAEHEEIVRIWRQAEAGERFAAVRAEFFTGLVQHEVGHSLGLSRAPQ